MDEETNCSISQDSELNDGVVRDRDILKRIAEVALPTYPQSLLNLCAGFVSAALVGRHCGKTALAAVGLSGLICNITGYSWLSGLSMAISTKSSQDWGGRNHHAIGVMLQRGFLILLTSCIPLALFWLNASWILKAMDQDPEVSELVGLYATIRSPTLVTQALKISISRTLNSIGKPKLLLKVAFAVGGLNVVGSFVLVPHFGFIGAPITLLICSFVDAFGTVYLASRDADFLKCWGGLTREAFVGWCAFLRIALPSFLLIALDLWTWDFIGFLAGWLSDVALSTQAVVPRIALLPYVVGAAMRQGAMTTIGNLLGEAKPCVARRAARLVVLVASVLIAIQLFILFLFRDPIARMFTSDSSILSGIANLFPFCLAFSFFDGMQSAQTGIINACGKQYLAAPFVILFYWVLGLPLGCIFAFRAHWGLRGVWIGMIVAVIGHVLSYAVVVRCINWERLGIEVRERIRRERSTREDDVHAGNG